MPIEIRELHIKAMVVPDKNQQASHAIRPEDISRLKKEITREVTDKVLKTLKQLNER